MGNDLKEKLGSVYSTNLKFDYNQCEDEKQETTSQNQENLYVNLDKKKKRKDYKLIEGFIGS